MLFCKLRPKVKNMLRSFKGLMMFHKTFYEFLFLHNLSKLRTSLRLQIENLFSGDYTI